MSNQPRNYPFKTQLLQKITWKKSNSNLLQQFFRPQIDNTSASERNVPWSQRLSFNIIFLSFGNLRREALNEAPSREIKGTLSNRRCRPDDGNRKLDISFETSLRMYNTLWPDVALKLRTWERGVSRRDENPSTSCFCFDPFSVLLCYFRAEPR